MSNTTHGETVDLGALIERFGPSRAVIVAGALFGLLGAALGFFLVGAVIVGVSRGVRADLPLWSWKDASWFAVFWLSFLGIGWLAGGIYFIRLARGLTEIRLDFCEQGMRRRYGKTVVEIPWSTVTQVQEFVADDHLPLFKWPFGLVIRLKSASERYVVKTAGGAELRFSVYSVSRIERLGRLLRDRTHVAGIHYETVTQRR